MTKLSLSIALLLCLLPEAIVGFVPVTFQPRTVCRVATLPDQESVVDAAAGDDGNDEEDKDDDAEDETDIDFLFQIQQEVWSKLPQDEKVWRCVKKPLLRIGSKGATHAHGNSLRQLLEDHTVVKVKVNTKKFGTLENAVTSLTELAVENGAPSDMEMIQMREKEKTILFGMPGTMQKVKEGTFPPPLSAA